MFAASGHPINPSAQDFRAVGQESTSPRDKHDGDRKGPSLAMEGGGRASAFEDIFVQHHNKILRYAERRLPPHGSAEEVMALVMEAAWYRWSDGKKVELPWLYRVAANKIADHYRAEERRQALEAALTHAAESRESGTDSPALIALQAAILQLGAREREAILLTYWEGLAAAEAAQALGCTTVTAWALLSRARKKLKHLLEDEVLGQPERSETHD